MEFFQIENNELKICALEGVQIKGETQYFGVLEKESFDKVNEYFHFPDSIGIEVLNPRQFPTLEIHPDLLFMTVNSISWHERREDWLVPKEMNLILGPNYLLWVENHKDQDQIMKSLLKSGVQREELNVHTLLAGILEKVVENDRRIITEMERRITELEDDIITYASAKNREALKESPSPGPKGRGRRTKVYRSHMEEIIRHRKRILFLKKFIEPLDEILEDLSEYSIDQMGKNDSIWIRRLAMKAARNSRNLSNLRDYVTQVREAWQAQVDIGLNDIMRVFTVITTIFLPLTLIAGWYGMNFQGMPELSWRFGYPFAFLLSFITLGLSLWYFKKNKFI